MIIINAQLPLFFAGAVYGLARQCCLLYCEVDKINVLLEPSGLSYGILYGKKQKK